MPTTRKSAAEAIDIYTDKLNISMALSLCPLPLSIPKTVEPPTPIRYPTPKTKEYIGNTIFKAASPSPPTPCPIKIVSNRIYIDVTNAAPTVGKKYFKNNFFTSSFTKSMIPPNFLYKRLPLTRQSQYYYLNASILTKTASSIS